MKKILTLLAAFVLTIGMVTARPVDRSTAKQVAENFYHLLTGSTAEMSIVVTDFTEFYVLTTGGTDFVMVPSDDCTTPIVGYSLTSKFVNDNMPRHMRSWFDGIEESIRIAKTKEQQPAVAANWQAMQTGTMPQPLTATTVSPLIATTWNQAPYYNDLCPVDSSEYAYYNYKLVTGCVATATAQIMKYWEHPTKGYGSHTYNHNTYGTQSANFGNTTYDWDNMPNELSSTSSSTEVNAVATLMYHIGVADEMDYGLASAGGSGAHNYNWNGMLQASSQSSLQSYFKYKPTMYAIGRDDMSADEYDAALMKELDASRPILYSGRSATGGHSFVVDGYDELNYNSTMFHINWGWGGYNDGYFPMGGLEPTASGIGGNSESAYNQQNVALLGIEPNSNWGDNSTVSATVYGSGTVSGTGSYNFGDTVQLMAFADEGYRFDNWGSGSRFNPMQFVANGGDVDVTANFKAINETDTISYCGSGHYLTGLGYGSAGSDVFWGIRIPSSSIASGKALKAVEFYAVGAGNFTVSIYTGASLPSSPVSTTTVAASKAGWVQMTLSSPISVASGSHIWIGISNNEYAYPAAMTYGSGNEDGALWTNSFYYTGWDQYSFMVRGIMGEDNGEPLPGECDTPLTSLNEGFENSLDCWTFIDADGDGFGWEQDSYPIHDYNGLMSLSYDMNGTYDPLLPDNWAVSPAVTISDSNTALIWWAQAMCSDSYAADKYSVYVGTGNDVDNYTQVYTETFTNDLATKRTVYLSDYVGQTIHVAFRHHDCTDMCGVIIDDVSIDVAAPPVDCSQTLTTLNEEFSEEIQCWTLLDEDGDGYGWLQSNGYMQSDSYTYTALTPDNWLITPKVLLPNEDCHLSLDLQTTSGSYFAEHYGIYVSTTGTATSDFTLLFEETCSDYSNWQNMQVDLSAYAGQEVYLAVRHFDCTDQYYLRVDNMKVETGGAVLVEKYTVNISGNGGYYAGNVGSIYYYSTAGDFSQEVIEGTSGLIRLYSINSSDGSYGYNYVPEYAELKNLTVNGANVDLSTLEQYDNLATDGYKSYYYYYTVEGDMDIVATYGPFEEVKTTYSVTVNNPDGGYVYYCERDEYNNQVQCNRIYAGTTTLDIPVGHRFCVDFGDINPNMQPAVNISKQYAMVSSLSRNGEALALDGTDASVEITDDWADYGYRLYTVCDYYTSDVTFDVTYSAYDDTEDKENATLTVINNGGGYLAYLSNGSQYRIYDTMYRAMTEGSQFTFTFGTFTPLVDWSNLVDTNAMRLEHLYFDGEELALDTTVTPGLVIYNHNDEGYIFYNYTYTQDTGKHTIEFVYGPYSDSENCDPVAELKVDWATDSEVALSWLPAPSSTGDYTVKVSDGKTFTTSYANITFANLEPETEYTVTITSACLNGDSASASITFTTYGPLDSVTFYTNNSDYLASFMYRESWYGINNNTTWGGYSGETLHIEAASLSAELANQWGYDPTTRQLDKVYLDGVELPIDGSDDRVKIYTNLNGNIGQTLYSFDVAIGEVHSVQLVYTGDCPAVEVNSIVYDGGNAYIDWYEHSGVTYTFSVNGVEDTNDVHPFTIYGLQSNETYEVVITALCPNGETVDTTLYIHQPEQATLTVINNGGGHLQTLDGSDWLMDETSTYSTYQYTGAEGDYYQFAAFSFPIEYASAAVLNHNANRVKSISYDGVSLPLDGSDDRIALYGLVDNEGNSIPDAVAYVFSATLGEVSTVEVVFGSDDIDSVNCYAVTNLQYDYDAENAYFSWGVPSTSDGNYEVYLDGELYATTKAAWFDFYGLSQNTTYTVTIRANCLNGSYADTTVTFTTKNYAGYTLKNPDGGQVYTPQLGYISDTEPVYVEGYEGDATFVQLLGMTHDYAENNGFDITAYQVESLIVDGTPIALDGSDTNLVIYDFLSEYGEIYYLYHFTMGDVDEIEVHFTGDQPDTANCTTPDNFRIYDLGTDYVEFAWTTPASSNGTFQITLTDSNGNVQQVSDVIICQPMGQTSYHWMYGLDGGVTYTATLTNFCLNGNSADTSITFTTVSYSTVTVTKNQNGLLSNPEWGGQLPVGTNTITGVTGNQSYFMAGSFSAEAATEYGWSLKYRTISEMKVDGVAVDINDYIYDTVYTEGGNMYVRYVYWFYYGDISTFEISYTGDDLPSYDYTLKNNGGYMRFIDYGSSASINFESDTTVTVDSANTVITLFYSYNPNHPDNAGITLGAGHEILSEVYLDGESIPIDGSDSRLVVDNYMSDEGYIIYYIQHVAEGPHTIEGVFTEWVEPEKVQFTFTNTGNGPMSYYVDPDDEILVVGTMTDSVEMFSSVTTLFISIDPSKASDFGLSEEDLAYYDGTKLSAVYLDGESIAIDGSDSRISIVDYSMYGLDGLIFYTLEVDANGPHTIEGVFVPWSDTPSDTNTYTITIKNPDGGYMFVGDDMIEDSVVTYTLAAGKTLTIEMATYDPLYYTSFPFIGAEKLTEVIYDGENIALDGSNPLLTVEYGYTSATLYFMTVTADADHTVEAHYVSGIDSTLTYHDVTLINNGGYMTYIVGNGSQTMVEDTTVLNLPEGTIVTVCASTDAPTGTYYSYPDYTQLNHFYFDGKDIPLDGSDPTMQITDYMGTDGYLWYVYQFEVDADHTAECEFGPWTGDIDTTGESEQRIITFTNTGNGYMAQGDNLIVGTMTFTADSGISFYTTFASVHPNSSLGMNMTAAGFTGHKLSKIKVDGVEVPLVASDMLEIENLMATDSVIAYYLLLNTNTDHTIEGIFTAWDDSTIVNPDTTLYTFNLTNTGNGAMIYNYDDMDEYDIPFVKGSMSIKVPAGNTFIAEFIEVENTDNAEMKELFAELGITASKLDAIKLDGVSVPLVNSTNLIVVDNTVDEDIPEGVTIYALFVEAYSDHTIEGIFNGATPPDTVYYTIEAVSADTTMGTVTGGGTFLAGTTITLKASAKDGFHFVSWQDGDTNSQRTVVVSGNATYIATFSDKEGIDDLQLSHIAIYPNPATTKVTLDGLPTDAIVTIFDLGGRQIELFNTEGDQLSIDLGHYARGTYFVRISSSEGNAVRKLLVR